MKNDTILICNISGFFQKKTHIDIEKVGLTYNTLILIETRSFIIFNYFTNEKWYYSCFFLEKTHIDIEKVGLADNTLILIETRSFIIFNYFANEKWYYSYL